VAEDEHVVLLPGIGHVRYVCACVYVCFLCVWVGGWACVGSCGWVHVGGCGWVHVGAYVNWVVRIEYTHAHVHTYMHIYTHV
jgi:hypothetical protein